jgi:cell division protein FtsB
MKEEQIQALQEEKRILEKKINHLKEGDEYITALQSYIVAIDNKIAELT